MRDKIKHINSKGEVLEFNQLGILVNYNDLRDYEWTVSTSNNRITGFSKGVGKKTIPFIFAVDEEKANEIKNKFYEHFDIDVISQKAGYFEINGYKYHCFLTKSVKSDYLVSKKILTLKATLQSDENEWKKETVNTIDFSKAQSSGNALTYPFTYPFTYLSEKTANVVNSNFVESDAIIRVFGIAENPLVRIGKNIYQVNTSLSSDEYLEIDTLNRTVYKYDIKGNATNLFYLRNKEENIFNKIPSGTVQISANGDFLVDIVIIEKRGEPRWI